MLTVDAITKSFGGLTAVNRCSFIIEAQSITGLIGPNGAGKTTIFNLIAGAMKPDSGRIQFQGADITGRPAHELFHLGIMRTFQIPQEFAAMSVLENLMLVPAEQSGENLFHALLSPGNVAKREKEVRDRAVDVLEFLHLIHVIDELAGNLSGGQKKPKKISALRTDTSIIRNVTLQKVLINRFIYTFLCVARRRRNFLAFYLLHIHFP